MDFYRGKRVLVTGHTGFKGSWLCRILTMLGAEVIGYALEPETQPSLYQLAQLDKDIHSVIGDIRDVELLGKTLTQTKPEIVIHMAAQPLVLRAYAEPRYTFETNIMGTVNLLECLRNSDTVRSVVNVTSDKVYENKEWAWGYRENDSLCGHDPYSNSKSCMELVTQSYKLSFLNAQGIAVSTARAGNVIGGGDFSANRIIPDCVRSALAKKSITIRNPVSIRPYQHVLEPLSAYLLIAQRQLEDFAFADRYNVGPLEHDCVTTGELATLFCKAWGDGQTWETVDNNYNHEAVFLKLDCSHIKQKLNWKPKLNINQAITKTVEWSKCYQSGNDIHKCMHQQINNYFGEKRND